MNLPSLPASLWHLAVENYRKWLVEQGLSSKTVENYISDLRRWLTWLNDHPGLLANDLTPSVEQYLEDLATDHPLSTVNRRIAALRRFADFLVQQSSQGWSLDQRLFGGAAQRPTAWNQWLDRFAVALSQAGCNDVQLQNFVGDVSLFLSRFPEQDLEQTLNKYEVARHLRELRQKGAASVDLIETRKSLQKFSAWATETGYFLENPLGNWWTRLLSASKFNNPGLPKLNQDKLSKLPAWRRWYLAYHRLPFTTALHLAVLVVFASMLSVFAFRQFGRDVATPFAYPSAPVRPNRQLSFQGRLTDSVGTPISTATNVTFSLHDDPSAGNELWNSGTCSIDPDQDGVFSTALGDTCGSEIPEDVFSELANVWLEIEVGGETLSPRQQISSVPYALNTETVQGFPVSLSGGINTIPVINALGQLIIGASNPSIVASSGAFLIQGESLNLATEPGGDITIQPGLGGTIEAIGETNVTGNFSASGTVTFSGLANGLIRATSGVLSGGATVDLATETTGDIDLTTQVTGTLPIANGGTNSTATPTAGGIAYGTGTAFAFTAAGSSGECLISAGTSAPAFGSCAGAVSGSIPWQVTNGTANLKNTTLDMLIGGDSTASAKFAILNVNSGTPTASVSAGAAGAAFLTANGSLSTTARQPLVIGNSSSYNTTGNVLISPNGTGNVAIGTTTPNAAYKLDVNGHIRANDTVFADGGSFVTFNAAGSFLGNTTYGAGGGIGYGANMTQVWAGSGFPLVFGTAGTENMRLSAEGNLGVGTNAPTSKLHVEGFYGGNALARFNETGGNDILTASSSGTTRFRIDTNGNAALLQNINTAGSFRVHNSSSGTNANTSIAVGNNTHAGFGFFRVNSSAAASLPDTFQMGTIGGYPIAFLTNNTEVMRIAGNGNVNIGGDTTPNALFNVGSTSQFQVNSSGAIAAATGITSSGTITFSGFSANGGLLYTNGSGVLAQTAVGANGECLISAGGGSPTWGSCSAAVSGVIPWQVTNGTANLKNTTLDLLVGGDSTASADFAVLNVNGSGPATASVSGNLIVMPKTGLGGNVGIGTLTPNARLGIETTAFGNEAIRITTAGGVGNVLSLTEYSLIMARAASSNQNLTIGTANQTWGATGGNVIFTPNGTERLRIATSGNVGIGTTTPTALLDVAGTASLSGTLAFRGTTDPKIDILNGENFGIRTSVGGDAGLSEKFTILNNGNVGIGTTSPAAVLTVGGNTRLNASGNALLDYNGNNLIRNTSGTMSVGNAAINVASTYTVGSGASQSFVRGSTTDLFISGTGNVGIGTTSPLAPLHISAGYSSNAAAIINQLNSGDILTASASGTTRLRLTNGGDLILASGDLQIGAIGLNDVGSSNTTSGASLVGTYDEFDNSNSTTVQDVLDDLDAAITSASSGSFDLAGDSGTPETIAPGNTLSIVGGTNGIDTVVSATDTLTLNLDTTEIGTTTFGSGSGFTWTFNAGATDPTIAFASDALTFTAGTNTFAGNVAIGNNTLSGGTAVIDFTNFDVASNGNTTIGGTLGVTGISTFTGNVNANGGFDVDDAFVIADGGVLTTSQTANFDGAADFDGDVSISDTNIAFDGGSTTFTTTGAFTLTPGGAVLLGDGGDTLQINSSNWDVSTAGVFSGLSGLSSSGTITFSGLSDGLVRATSGVLSGGATVDLATETTGDIDLTTQVTGTLPIANGGTNSTATPTQGGIAYGTGTAYAFTSAGSGGECLLSNGTSAPSWGSCLAGATNYWAIASGALYSTNATTDFLIGGTSTASADFAVLNVNGAGPATASVSGNLIVFPKTGLGGQVGIGTTSPTANLDVRGTTRLGDGTNYTQIDADGDLSYVGTADYLVDGNDWAFRYSGAENAGLYFNLTDAGYQFTNTIGGLVAHIGVAGTFNIGGDSTPDAMFTVGSTSQFRVNSSGIISMIDSVAHTIDDVSGDLTLTSNSSSVDINDSLAVTGAITAATDETINGIDINAGAVSDITTLSASSTITFSSFTSNGGLLYTNGSGVLAQTGVGANGECLISNGGGAPSWGNCVDGITNYWGVTAGALHPVNSTTDFLIGGTATASAKLALTGVNSGTPTLVINDGVDSLYLAADGVVTATDTFLVETIGGNITLNANSGAADVIVVGDVNLSSGSVYRINNTSVLSNNTLGSGVVTSSLTTVGALNAGSITSGFGTIDNADTITGTTLNGTTGINTGASAGTQRLDASGNLVNIANITASGTITLSGLNVAGGVVYTNGSGVLASVAGTSGQCLQSNGTSAPSWGSCDGPISSYWQLNNTHNLSATNLSYNILLGHTATASANTILNADGSAVFNEQGLNRDFRIETDTISNAFFVDASADAIGFGTSTPGYQVQFHNSTGQANFAITTDVNVGAANVAQMFFVSDYDGTPSYASIGQFQTDGLRFSGAANLVNPDLFINGDGAVLIGGTSETLSNTGYVMDGPGDLYVAGMAGIEGNVYTDGAFVAGASTTYGNGSISQSSGETLTIGTTAAGLTLQTTTSGNIILNSAGTIELQDNTNITGNLDASGTLTAGTGNAFQVDASGNLTTSGTITAATGETINGIDINAGTVSDVVNLTINGGGDLTIGSIGLNDVGSSNTTSGASLVGVYDEFDNSAATTVQDVLDDLDAAIAGFSSYTGWTLAGDSGSSQTISSGNTASIVGGTNGIDTVASATDTLTLNLDTTEIGTTTFGSGSGLTWTFDAGATDPTIAFASDAITFTAGTNTFSSAVAVNGNLTIGDAGADTVTINSNAWTFANDTNFVLSGGTNGLSFDTNTLSIDASNDRVGIGTTAPSAKLHAIATTEQMRLGYDTSNYAQFTVQSNGDLNINAVAGSGTPKISLADNVQIAAGNVLDVTGDVRFTFGTDLMSVNEELRVTYDPSNYTSFITNSSGTLTIDPTGAGVEIDGFLQADTLVSVGGAELGGDLVWNSSVTDAEIVTLAGDLTITPDGGDVFVDANLATSGNMEIQGSQLIFTSDGEINVSGPLNLVASGVGIRTNNPGRALEINDASGNNLRLTYNDSNGSAANYVDFLTNSSGMLTIDASGDWALINHAAGVQGQLDVYGKLFIAGEIQSDGSHMYLNTGGMGVSIDTVAPSKMLDINSATGDNLRLIYNDSANYADFLMSSSGDLTIAPSGEDVALNDVLTITNTSMSNNTAANGLILVNPNPSGLIFGDGSQMSPSIVWQANAEDIANGQHTQRFRTQLQTTGGSGGGNGALVFQNNLDGGSFTTRMSLNQAGLLTVSGGITNTGTFTNTGAITSSGGNISLNASSGSNTIAIGTGTTSGAVTIGGGSNTLAINTTSWDISTAGVATGFTGITSTNTITGGSLAVTNDVNGTLTLGRQDNTNEGGHIALTGAGSYISWNIDSYQNNLRLFTPSGGTNIVQIFNNGGFEANLDVEGYVEAKVGSNSAPSFTFEGDANTGMFQDGADLIGFTAGGTNSVTINSLGVRFKNTANGATCDSSTVGTFTYERDSGTVGLLYICREQASNGTYAWRNIANAEMTAGGPDLAEYAWASDMSLNGGDIVSVTSPIETREDFYDRFNIIRASQGASKKVLGVVSSDPGIILNKPDTSTTILGQEAEIDPHLKPLTLAGRVPVKVVTSAPLAQGDRIGLSGDLPGIGAKLTGSGFSVGTVLTTFNPSTANCTNINNMSEATWPNSNKDECYRLPDGRILAKVLILVNNEYSLADTSLQEDGSFTLGGTTGTALRIVDEMGNETAAITSNGSANFRSVVAQEMSTRFMQAESLLITGDATIEGTLTAQSARFAALQSNGASVSGTLYADRLEGIISAESVEGLEARITALVAAQTASLSATPEPDPETQGDIDTLSQGSGDGSTITLPGDLIVEGLFQADGGVATSTLLVDGTSLTKNELSFAVEATCSSETGCNTFAFQPSGEGTLTFLNSLVVMSDGSVTINGDLTVTGALAAGQVETDRLIAQGEELTIDLASASASSDDEGDVLGKLIIRGEDGKEVASYTADGASRFDRLIVPGENAEADDDDEDQSDRIDASSGTATLKSGKEEFTIRTTAAEDNSLIYLTATSATGNKVLFIKEQEDDKFTVAIDGSYDEDITFNWWVVGR